MESYFVQLVLLSVEKDILLWQTETTIVFKFIVQMGNFYTSLVAKEMEMDSLMILTAWRLPKMEALLLLISEIIVCRCLAGLGNRPEVFDGEVFTLCHCAEKRLQCCQDKFPE